MTKYPLFEKVYDRLMNDSNTNEYMKVLLVCVSDKLYNTESEVDSNVRE